MAAAFLGKLTQDWRNKHPPSETGGQLRSRLIREKQELLQKAGRPVKSAKSGFSKNNELPPIPTSWAWLSVDELSSKVADGVHKKPSYVDSGIPFLTVKNLTAGPGVSFANCKFVAKADHKEFIKRTHPEMGDILITKDGTLGVVRAVRTDEEFSIFVSLALVKPVDRQMTDYLEFAFQSPIVQDQLVGVGSGLQHIHLIDLRCDQIPIAPFDERNEIVCLVRAGFQLDRSPRLRNHQRPQTDQPS